ncbi:MAG: helix-turn-helix domain-containing protein [Thermoleophilia bacterium]|nr:helix-turn-helix domain-containing protein [Thermoleophilia bacterium]MDH4340231.1 helix-turn-helix domain-containing protein [Thermoleophilia bacterium]MDH5280461.1 helix-turn-helix domain-containing protein [Thermoleophilia bacterium]
MNGRSEATTTRLASTRYTIAEASGLTGLSKRALARRIERGQLPATREGRLRYVEAGALVEAGLLDPATGAPPSWAQKSMSPDVVAREVVQTLVRQSVELHEMHGHIRSLIDESRREDVALRDELERARKERRDLRRALEDVKAEIASLDLGRARG